ncbi:hypothetical protein K2173_028017 [Erythroxylum novogranatense]|uniref:LNS2/PITP domain-containing protein n=1 Tax=Erythroxylum novogranatense TaxID=1862640 RepID=A0AAV8U0U3_9ROSI|nr:hypothetical protein K2173_028017 [Erythroxylum novogranatense]
MYTMGRLGSYISGGLYTVSGPFHVFGGAVDIIVVEQPDGSFKSSPWYVRFGKFQGVLKAKETIVNISVNGVDANFHMHLDQRGQAYFLKELEGEEDSMVFPSSSSDEMDGQFEKNMIVKSKSCDFDANQLDSAGQIDETSGKIVARANTPQSRILGLAFRRRSSKRDSSQVVDDSSPMARIGSLERAEIAANLLEVNWSTNLAISKPRKGDTLPFSSSHTSHGQGDEKMLNGGEQIGHVELSTVDTVETNVNHCKLADQTISCDVVGDKPWSSFESLEYPVEKTTLQSWTASTMEHIVQTSSTLSTSVLEVKHETSHTARNIDDHTAENVDGGGGLMSALSDVITPEAQISYGAQACLSHRSVEGPLYEERITGLPRFAKAEEEIESNRSQTFVHCETSDSSITSLHGSSTQIHQTVAIASEGPTELLFNPETLRETARELLPEQAETIELDMEQVDAFDHHSQRTSSCSSWALKPDVALTITQIISVNHDSLNEVDSRNICTVDSFSNPSGDLHKEIIGDSDSVPMQDVCTVSLQSSAEEQFLFSDLDELEATEMHCQYNLPDNSTPFCLEGYEEIKGSGRINDEACSLTENQSDGLESLIESSYAASSPIAIPEVQDFTVTEVGWPAKSLPNLWSPTQVLDKDYLVCSLSHSLDSNSKSLEWTGYGTNEANMNSDSEKENQSPLEQDGIQILGGLENGVHTPVGDPSKPVVASNVSWKLWPFSLKKSRSRKIMQPVVGDSKSSTSEKASESNINLERDTNMPNSNCKRRMVKAKTPTSEQLASLNLQLGSNSVTFTFSTSMWGQQKVEARIYLWKWNTRIVISDVDGTITKSDVLGQFMPLVGLDWSQTGVAHLFSAIKENGYELLFLSARAISQAYHTRQFLVNLKQDGKALPDGPIVISPDGLFPSLFREVIRRAPHEFKISCLEDIKALFPSDCNPFYAGFGNRDTDEISYLKVGIPRGKIFIINPKGEVAVQRRVDKKSYTSLQTLVHDMFPPARSSEQEAFNSWNFWKLPPPLIDF